MQLEYTGDCNEIHGTQCVHHGCCNGRIVQTEGPHGQGGGHGAHVVVDAAEAWILPDADLVTGMEGWEQIQSKHTHSYFCYSRL